MASAKWYLYVFADGTEIYCGGMNKLEKQTKERQHGKLLYKRLAG